MNSRRIITVLAVALLSLSFSGCTKHELPVIDQAIEDLKDQVDPNNPAHQDLVSAGYNLVDLSDRLILASGEKSTVTTWLQKNNLMAPEIIVHGDRIVLMKDRTITFRCEVLAANTWRAAQLTTAYAQLVAQTQRQSADDPFLELPAELSATVDGTTKSFVCG